MKIVIEAYSPSWLQKFEQEKARLERILPARAIGEHIGSTAVPGLAAKPIIDIMIGLPDFSQADSLVPPIESLGYEYVSQFEAEMPYRRYFRKVDAGVRTHHLHMVATGSEFWNRHLAFRDYLRSHPDVAAQYAALKHKLAERDWQDMNDYAAAKTDFIRSIETRAL